MTMSVVGPVTEPVTGPVTGPVSGRPVPAPDAFEPPAKQRRAVARVLGLSDLLTRRPDLHGVYPPADVAAEAVSWSA
jgi:hypothetical protein